jgi:16S rRNA (guanine527-N7)-methyltransferase
VGAASTVPTPEDKALLCEGAGRLGVSLAEGQVDALLTYLDGMRAWNERAGLTSPSALADAVRVHLLDSLALVPVLARHAPEARSLADVGTGAGLPGLAVAVALEGLEVTLVESVGKKAAFLRWAVEALGLAERVAVLETRAEEAGRARGLREAFDVVTARALGPLPVVAELTLPLVRVGGVLIAPRGVSGAAEAAEAAPALETLGARLVGVEPASPEGGRERATVVIATKERHTPGRYPRRVGTPAKEPLGVRA